MRMREIALQGAIVFYSGCLKKLLNTQSRQLPWSCFQGVSLLRVREASCACVCLVHSSVSVFTLVPVALVKIQAKQTRDSINTLFQPPKEQYQFKLCILANKWEVISNHSQTADPVELILGDVPSARSIATKFPISLSRR